MRDYVVAWAMITVNGFRLGIHFLLSTCNKKQNCSKESVKDAF